MESFDQLPSEQLAQLLRAAADRLEGQGDAVVPAQLPPRRPVRLPVDPGPVDDLARARARKALLRAGVPLGRAAR